MSKPLLALIAAASLFAGLAPRVAGAQPGHDMSAMDPTIRAGRSMGLGASSPADGSTVPSSPAEISMRFDHALTFETLVLTNSVGQQIPTRATLPTEPVDSLRFPVVIPLQPGAYRVAWRASDAGQPVSGSFAFKLQSADGAPAPPSSMSGHHH